MWGKRKKRKLTGAHIIRPVQGTPIARHTDPHEERRSLVRSQRIKLFFVLLCFIITLGLLLFHSFFRVVVIDVDGLTRIDRTEFISTANAAIDYNRLLLLPSKNFFLVRTDLISDALSTKYPLDEIQVRKVFPNKIVITIKEKISTVLYDTGEEYVTVDLSGVVIELLGRVAEHDWFEEHTITTTTLADGTVRVENTVTNRWHVPNISYIRANYGQLPTVYDTTHPKVSHNEKIVDKRIVEHIISWYKHLQGNYQLPIEYFTIEENGRDVTIHVEHNRIILTRVIPQDDKQMVRFDEAVKKNISLDEARYIDVRFLQRVYTK